MSIDQRNETRLPLRLKIQREAFDDWAYGDGHIWAEYDAGDPTPHDACGCERCRARLLAAEALGA